jgi:hypothetical protein
MTPSEQLVYDLCKRSFLSLWSYANPQRPDGRELYDALLVFGEHIVIFSVKEITLQTDTDPEVAARRWVRKAVDASIDQLVGAKRQLAAMDRVIRHDGTPGLSLVSSDKRHIHLVAVAAGSDRSVPFKGGGDGENYVHAMDEHSFRIILRELDTAGDFLHYLQTKESFQGSLVYEGEENLLALYLHRGRALPTELHLVYVEDGAWEGFGKKPEVQARKEADRTSYLWDQLVERFITDYDVTLEEGPAPPDHEKVVRTMASENRFARRNLIDSWLGWLATGQAGARACISPSGVGYVFGSFPRDWSREDRVREITLRCFAARSRQVLNRATVVGIATEVSDGTPGASYDAVYGHLPEWSDEDETKALKMRKALDLFDSPTLHSVSVDEYPVEPPTPRSNTERNRLKRLRRSGKR